MRLWYFSHRRPVKAQASLRICVVSPEPSLFTYMKYGSRRSVQPKIRHLAPLNAHAHLKNEFTEVEKYHNLMSWLKGFFFLWRNPPIPKLSVSLSMTYVWFEVSVAYVL